MEGDGAEDCDEGAALDEQDDTDNDDDDVDDDDADDDDDDDGGDDDDDDDDGDGDVACRDGYSKSNTIYGAGGKMTENS